MTTRADKFLEGFKLGKLGAGKQKFTPELLQPEKTSQRDHNLKILKEGSDIYNGKELPFIFWQDYDGLKYGLHLSIGLGEDKTAIYFHAGENLEHVDDSTGRAFKNPDFMGISKILRSVDGAVQLVDLYIHIIKKDGIMGLMENFSRIFQSVSGFSGPFNKWLRDKLLGLDK
jgi:hypothetical protein